MTAPHFSKTETTQTALQTINIAQKIDSVPAKDVTTSRRKEIPPTKSNSVSLAHWLDWHDVAIEIQLNSTSNSKQQKTAMLIILLLMECSARKDVYRIDEEQMIFNWLSDTKWRGLGAARLPLDAGTPNFPESFFPSSSFLKKEILFMDPTHIIIKWSEANWFSLREPSRLRCTFLFSNSLDFHQHFRHAKKKRMPARLSRRRAAASDLSQQKRQNRTRDQFHIAVYLLHSSSGGRSGLMDIRLYSLGRAGAGADSARNFLSSRLLNPLADDSFKQRFLFLFWFCFYRVILRTRSLWSHWRRRANKLLTTPRSNCCRDSQVAMVMTHAAVIYRNKYDQRLCCFLGSSSWYGRPGPTVGRRDKPGVLWALHLLPRDDAMPALQCGRITHQNRRVAFLFSFFFLLSGCWLTCDVSLRKKVSSTRPSLLFVRLSPASWCAYMSRTTFRSWRAF